MPRAAAATAAADPFLFDAERLQALSSEPVVRRGVAYFKENRVVDLGWNGERVWAAVEGTGPGPYQVELSLDEEGELVVDCDCPFDWEPACKHAVATLLAYGARQPVSEGQRAGAADAALAARVERGRSEVAVRHVAGDRWLGTWEASSFDGVAAGRGPWRVELRSVGERLNHCSCPDFATNRLGTCKHVEAVLHRLRKRGPRKFERAAEQGPAASIVHLDWSGADSPRIRLRRAAGGAPPLADEHFDADGFLAGPLPEAFQRFSRALDGQEDVVVVPEVHEHLRRLAEEADRRGRAAALGEAIRGSGGTLPGIAARLYSYQVEGVAFLAAAGRALLADDMGLGKTLQAIAAAAVLRDHAGAQRALVVCPASLKHQWAREIDRFTGLEAVVVEGPPAARLALYRRRAAFTLANYELVLRDGERIQAELSPDLLVLDEAQRIKNWRTRTAAAVKALDTPYAFVLTGTPLENRLEDLYSLMQVVDPRVLGPLWRYLLDFHVSDDRGRVLGYRNLAELRRRLAPVMLRRDRSLVRDQLPERMDTRLDVDLDRRQRPLHDEALAAAARLASVAQKRPLTPSEEKRMLSCLQAARMACDAAGLVDGETVGSPKLAELASLLEELCVDGGRKVVVFSQWERMTRMAEEVARGLGLGVARLHGGVPTARRGALIDRFRDDPAVQVFLSTDAGGVGLNLQSASVLINLDLPWNPAVLEQRIGRVHRLGQGEPVQVVLMVARRSYEERIAELLAAKRELFHGVMDEDAAEDVVGVSKRMVEAALASLGELEDTAGAAGPEAGAGGAGGDAEGGAEADGPAADSGEARAGGSEADVDDGAGADGPAADVGDGTGAEGPAADAGRGVAADGPAPEPVAAPGGDGSPAHLVSRLQAALGERIERVVAAGGGLVMVVDAADPAARERAQDCAGAVPVAVVDAATWAALDRLGAASPAAGAVLFERPAAPPLLDRARRKLRAAHTLAAQEEDGEALALAAAAVLHAAAAAAGLAAPPPPEEAALWLHAELVPAGLLTPADAAQLDRAIALSAAPTLPAALRDEILAAATVLVEALAGRPPAA